ncbi:MAG: transglycosylase domain-containing protein, partial [Clostridia bacterium]|nr:transglycosylase domain-containing protein [Clostridia bacterium]
MEKKKKKKIRWSRELIDALDFLFKGAKIIFSAVLCILVTVLIIGTVCGLICGTTFALYLSSYVDATVEEFDLLASEQKQTSQIFIDDGTGNLDELEDEKLYASENRVWVDYTDIPQNLIDAYVAEEDKRFFDHNGVDWIRTAYATAQFVIGQADTGGSTLTQQLIKNITGEDDNTPQRKIEEIFRALNLEKQYSKEQILEMYLNTIYLSQGCNGVQAASYTYFGKPVSELELIECAAIAAITQNPSRWDPKLHPENNIERRDRILANMLEQGKITQAEFDAAYGQELKIYEAEPDDPDDP